MPRVTSRLHAEIALLGVDLDAVLKVVVHERHRGVSPELVFVPTVDLMAMSFLVPVEESRLVQDDNGNEALKVFLFGLHAGKF